MASMEKGLYNCLTIVNIRGFSLVEWLAIIRYFASKLWYGETFFLQIDAHSLFRPGWDTAFVSDIKR